MYADIKNEHSKKTPPRESELSKRIPSNDSGIVSADRGGAYFMGTKVSSRNKKHYLYLVRNPETTEIVYIGVTSNLYRRKLAHSNGDQNTKQVISVFEKILGKSGRKAKLEIIREFANYDIAHSMEVKLIKKIKPAFNVYHNPS